MHRCLGFVDVTASGFRAQAQSRVAGGRPRGPWPENRAGTTSAKGGESPGEPIDNSRVTLLWQP